MELFFFVPEDLAALVPDPPGDSDFDELEDPELMSDFAEESALVSPGFAESFAESEEAEPEDSEELVPDSPDALPLEDDDRASFL